MACHIRLWQRDRNVISEASRSPLLTGHIARLHDFPSRKKAAERLCPLYRLGVLKRVGYYHPAMQGKPEFVYYTGARPHPRTLTHTLGIAEVRVRVAEWLRESTSYSAHFWYAHEVTNSSGLEPDATLLVRKAEHAALIFIEVDCGTETIRSTAGYSLAGKLEAYAAYFDEGTYQYDFSWAGPLQGFRVALILPPTRLPQVRHLLERDGHDFVLLTTSDRLTAGLHQPIFVTHDNRRVDLLGRQGELVGAVEGGDGRATSPRHG